MIIMKIAIVTGASKGLGREFVKLLDQEKQLDQIWGIARSKEQLESLQKSLTTPMRVLAYDLTQESAINALLDLLKKEKPSVQFLINAAGIGSIGSYKDIPLHICTTIIDLNCRAAVLLSQASIPFMPVGSHILEICSTAAFQPLPYLNIYAASKAFLYHYSRALHFELTAQHISVTAVCPYWIKDTEFISTAKGNKSNCYINNFIWGSLKKTVAKKALNDAKKNLAVSTPGIICTLHHIACKFLPDSLLISIWNFIRRYKI